MDLIGKEEGTPVNVLGSQRETVREENRGVIGGVHAAATERFFSLPSTEQKF